MVNNPALFYFLISGYYFFSIGSPVAYRFFAGGVMGPFVFLVVLPLGLSLVTGVFAYLASRRAEKRGGEAQDAPLGVSVECPKYKKITSLWRARDNNEWLEFWGKIATGVLLAITVVMAAVLWIFSQG
ncbi:hypothetical protein KW786_01225 [Candidatus Parcubacteria bacterium]|nr:hypothetical protein [Candidatus Parcubacteria bacterium]